MSSCAQQLKVYAPSHQYPIFIGETLWTMLEDYIQDYLSSQVVIVSNDTVAPLYLNSLENLLATKVDRMISIVLPDGEKYKNTDVLNSIYTQLLEHRVERRASLIALGGGVIGDMAGFAAATYQRGMPFIQIPTTLLSQVDSSVGGKTGINHPRGKNMVGAFYQPQAVFAGIDVLSTLPARELSAGLAEVIKYALLGDVEFLAVLEDKMDAICALDAASLIDVVHTCCQMKADIVAQDEKESGVRAFLNLGHTFAHAIETQMGYGVWLHGEAVAAGMLVASRLSEALGYLSPEDTHRVEVLLARAGLPTKPPVFPFDAWMGHMQHDKKVASGNIRFVLLEALGKARMLDAVDVSLLKWALSPYLP